MVIINKMDIIPDDLKDILYYDYYYNFYGRKDNKKMIKKSKNEELFYIIENITKEKINPKNWIYNEELCYEYYTEEQTCICSQSDCKDIFFKKHINTNIVFKLGSKCIVRFHNNDEDKEAEQNIINDIIRDSKKEKCKIEDCDNKVPNKKSNHGKKGYCSKECEESDYPKCYCDINSLKKKCRNGKNSGKSFFSCSKSYMNNNCEWVNGCNFFQWI